MVFKGYGNQEEQNLEDLLSEFSEGDEETSIKVGNQGSEVSWIFAHLSLESERLFFTYVTVVVIKYMNFTHSYFSLFAKTNISEILQCVVINS